MQTHPFQLLILSMLAAIAWSPSGAAEREVPHQQVAREQFEARSAAEQRARAMGWPVAGRTPAGADYRLVGLSPSGSPLYQSTLGSRAAVSANALAAQAPPWGLAGRGVVVGIWDSGSVRGTHQEFQSPGGPRVTVIDGSGITEHATGVAGTAAASGVDDLSTGSAPLALLRSHDWSSDRAELIAGANTGYSTDPGISVSNHSYGYIHGWTYGDFSGETGWHWTGFGYEPDGTGAREDALFGQYSVFSEQWDALLHAHPHVVTFWAAGNDRNDNFGGSTDGDEAFFYYDHLADDWMQTTYTLATAPFADGFDGGFDTVITRASAKNVIAVGAVVAAEAGGERDPSLAAMTAFSGWGPADDGRVKPDVVANGHAVYIPRGNGDTNYRTSSGTSFAAPSAAGVGALLFEEARARVPGWEPRASTVKALLLHGATDLGRPGPDYENGFGLVDALASLEPLAWLDHPTSSTAFAVAEGRLDSGNPADTFDIQWDGAEDLVVTLAWTDPPTSATAFGVIDDRTPALVHDMDLRVEGPGGTVWMPFTLDPDNPLADAVPGDNVVDTVEQVRVPAGTADGPVTVRVEHKGSLAPGGQWYSLAVSGHAPPDTPAPLGLAAITPASAPRGQVLPVAITGGVYPLGSRVELRDGARRSAVATVEVAAWTPGEMAGMLDLGPVPTGVYDVVVTTPDGRSATLEAGFEVQGLASVEEWERLER